MLEMAETMKYFQVYLNFFRARIAQGIIYCSSQRVHTWISCFENEEIT